MERRLRKLVAVGSALTSALAGAFLIFCGLQEETVQLQSDAEVTRQIAAGESHDYEVPMDADQLVQVVVYQEGVDVAVALWTPDADRVVEVDSPTGRQGPERLLAVTETAGTYRVVVRSVEKDAPPGSYRLAVEELRTALPKDRQRASAELTFSRAEALFMESTQDSLRGAVPLYQEAKEVWEELDDRVREADSLLRLGWTHRDLQEHGDAIAFLEEALEIYRQSGERHGEGNALNSLGGVWIKLRENQEALPLVKQAVEIGRGIGDKVLEAESLNNLGILFNRLGRIDEAIETYSRARKLYEELGDPRPLARFGSNIGILLIKEGKLEAAADNLKDAAETLKEAHQFRRAATALSSLGDLRKRQGRLDDALRYLEEALALRRQAGDRDGEAATLNSLGTTQLLRKKFDSARSHYEEAYKIFEELGDVTGRALILVNLGRLHVEMGDPQRALDLHQQAAPLIEGAGDQTMEASNLYGWAKALHDLHRFEAARKLLEETLNRVEEIRAETSNEGLRIAFFATRQHYYELYVDVLMHLDDEAAAFGAADQRRARALLEALGGQAEEIRAHADPKLVEKERSIQAELNDLEQRCVALERLRSPAEDEIAEIRKKQRATVLELDNVRGKLRTDLIQSPPFSLQELYRLLDPGTLLLAYSLGEERSFLWQISHQELKSYVLPDRQRIEEAALEAHRLLTSRSPEDDSQRRQLLKELSDMLLGPVAAELHGQRLLIVGEGALLHLPFAALPGPSGMEDAPEYLVERHETVYLPSISVLKPLRVRLRERAPAPKQLAIFADPVFVRPGSQKGGEASPDRYRDRALQRSVEGLGAPRLMPLPSTRVEANAILQLTRGEVMPALGYEATKEKVLDGGLDQYKILHFATHGLIHRDQPELTGLVLSLFNERGESLDGFLRLHEIYNLHLSAEMVVLSACQTGGGREVRGEGLLGLTRAFMYAGAPRLVVSLWSVADLGTAELMKRFYWNFLEGHAAPALALREAQRSMLKEKAWSHPYYWAGFVFQGEWWPPNVEPPIGEAQAGGVEEELMDPDYPGPDKICEDLPEPWMQKLCKQLRELAGD